MAPPLTALTGAIGSGKSTVARLFAELGASIISADELARRAVLPRTPAWREIKARFGPSVLNPDDSLNRQRLGDIVFANQSERLALEDIVHPQVRTLFQSELARLQADHPERLIIYEIPLLFETRHPPLEVQCIIVVSADHSVCVQRIVARDGCSVELAQKKLAAQMPLEEKERRADYVIRNNGDTEELRNAVVQLFAELNSISWRKPR